MTTWSVCVYCGSGAGRELEDVAAARELGAALAAHGWRLIYGGGLVGLMGAVAEGARAAGGYTIGIIPEGLLAREKGNIEANELLITTTLRECKGLMDARADAFVALPGGFGTLEELVETLTLRQLGYHNKPIIILNLDGYYDPLLAFFDHIVATGYARPEQRESYHIATSVAEVVRLLAAAYS